MEISPNTASVIAIALLIIGGGIFAILIFSWLARFEKSLEDKMRDRERDTQ